MGLLVPALVECIDEVIGDAEDPGSVSALLGLDDEAGWAVQRRRGGAEVGDGVGLARDGGHDG